MPTDLSLGEYLRRLRRRQRWGLQELAAASGLSQTHLSRIENDSVVPNADSVVRLANALGGDLEMMLEMADCLPREILERLVRRAERAPGALRRSAGVADSDPTFPSALIEDMDPSLRAALARRFGLSDRDAEGLFSVLERMGEMEPRERQAVIAFLAASAAGGGGH